MKIYFNKNSEYKKYYTSALLDKAMASLMAYEQAELAYQQGESYKWEFENIKTKIFQESPYEDIFDFAYDYRRWKIGLPIFIDIKLVEEEK